ncbi:transcription elongation factor GreAB [Seonamhaeicola sp. S2-3]|uniref:GreA/GreB family elongation factor n=1 Tax=Seonamhaeicola sp. S2-3 TaxID=1936081 RepID=UPI00097274F9|nr:GreA/GreB family elongation factor [Seonamhaeicola sp. S2-3]APY11732.1 transcription elongation factor GreAB [Seonamhaeicola sp. S2-3]
MKYGSIILEKTEYITLKRLLNLSESYKKHPRKYSVDRLKNELNQAIIVDEADIPKDVIRLNSVVTVTTTDGWENSFELVLPEESDYQTNKISILTPMGLAVIGYAQHDVIDWEFPGGKKSLHVESVSQKNKKQTI